MMGIRRDQRRKKRKRTVEPWRSIYAKAVEGGPVHEGAEGVERYQLNENRSKHPAHYRPTFSYHHVDA